jgi:hypothetical protein
LQTAPKPEAMGVSMRFTEFVSLVREPLSTLTTEPAFQFDGEVARFMWPPYAAELQVIDARNVRLALSAYGELIRAVELPLTKDAAWLAWNGIVAIFESNAG